MNSLGTSSRMNVAIRLDCNSQVGAGHLSRCLVLAEEVKRRQGEVIFLISEISEASWIKDAGYEFRRIDSSSEDYSAVHPHDWLVIDHYRLDARVEIQVSKAFSKVMVIDDLANRNHTCDLLLDHNAYLNPEHRYQNKIRPRRERIELLAGPQYALIRHEVLLCRENRIQGREKVIPDQIWVNFGGGDTGFVTLHVLQAIRLVRPNARLKILVTESSSYRKEIQQLVTEMNGSLFGKLKHPELEMRDCVLAIGGGGVSALERACLGIPSFVISMADNQNEICTDLSKQGVVSYFGDFTRIEKEFPYLVERLQIFFDTFETTQADMADRGIQLVDGLGVKRVVDKMEICL
ncbi:MAG: UDP-2,4-diacetamido-2,4,6-trideoxy-beta-L-altropyranose hydrolase [Proteobacteria bacterium]|nr:MAG: UDP-2,4-diacetamido-2,4,6-trideoxy-beta-L-altropyranose hydrolase [Pseudomonadota bacterium]